MSGKSVSGYQIVDETGEPMKVTALNSHGFYLCKCGVSVKWDSPNSPIDAPTHDCSLKKP